MYNTAIVPVGTKLFSGTCRNHHGTLRQHLKGLRRYRHQIPRRLAYFLCLLLTLFGCAPAVETPGSDAGVTPEATEPSFPGPAPNPVAEATPETSAAPPAIEAPQPSPETLPTIPRAAEEVPPAPEPSPPEFLSPKSWASLARDGIHDPRGEALQFLQQPSEALSTLPSAKTGNYVNWVTALSSGAIRPRAGIRKSAMMEVLDSNILLTDTKTMPTVTFSHGIHSEWLACSNCHDRLFVAQRGANDIRMRDILKGQSCGECHGSVAFPASECFRCHDGPRPGKQSAWISGGP